MAALEPSAPPPHRLGRHLLHTRIAVGGMAEIWLARTDGSPRARVVKKILPGLARDRKFVELFLHEGRVAERLAHPNIVRVLEQGEHQGVPYLVMEFVLGKNLRHVERKLLAAGERIPRPLVARVLAEICRALDHAHRLVDDQGNPLRLVHRDVSPDNILVAFDGVPKLIDFGIAKAASVAPITSQGSLRGRFAYLAPERVENVPIDHRADLYSAGAVLYEALSGRTPFEGKTDAQMALALAHESPTPLEQVCPDVEPALAAIAARAMARRREDRYPDAGAMAADLEDWLETQPTFGAGEVAAFMRERFAPDLAALEAAVGYDPAGPRPRELGGAAHEVTKSGPRKPKLRPSGVEPSAGVITAVRAIRVPPDPRRRRIWVVGALAFAGAAAAVAAAALLR